MEENNELVLLIDIDSILYYEAHKEKLEWAIQGIDERMERIFNENNTTKYIAFLTEGKCFRYAKALSSDYKGSRQGKSKPTWFSTLKAYLKAKYGAISIDGLEADDCVAYFDTKLPNSRICSPDKDVLHQCPGTHYNYQMESIKDANGVKIEGMFKSKGFITTSVENSYRFLYTQMLMGDSTDGISGIEKVGPKTAEKWINQCYENEGFEVSISTLEEMILHRYIDKYGQVEGISRFGETFKLVYLLKTDQDMIREIRSIPEIPEIQEYVVEQESVIEEKDKMDW